jgi:tripartite-type tricarboxylate transporter receptor subunit TctC
LLAGLSTTVVSVTAYGQSAEEFYRNRNVALIVGTETGGGYGAYAQLLARHMPHHIPGDPTFVVQSMPGASGRRAANYVYSAAPRDGSVIAMLEQNIPFTQVLGKENVRYDAAKFRYLGNLSSNVSVVVTWSATGVRTIEDARKKEVAIGATGGSGTTRTYAALMNGMLGTKFRVVTGYPGGNDINLAMERGEVGGRASYSWPALKSGKPEWLAQGKVNILAQIGLEKAPDLPDVPLLIDLAKTPEEHSVLWFFSSGVDLARLVVSPPEVPPERVAALRNAFYQTMGDPEFLAEAKRLGLDIKPTGGETVESVVDRLLATPQDVLDQVERFVQ